MLSLLPQSEGYLPLYILFVGTTAIINAVQSYTTLSYAQRLYPGTATTSTSKPANPALTSPVTPLSARTFGTWTFAVGVVRIFAAYHINEPSWYHLQIISNLIGAVHYFLEAFVYKTSPPSGPWLAPVIVSWIGTGWSIAQYNFYLR